jgi:type I restriction enzyme M protein
VIFDALPEAVSDVFEARYQDLLDKELKKGRPKAEASSKSAIFVLPKFFVALARWKHIDNELHHSTGDGPQGSGRAEEANTSLEGVLTHIDFNRKVGQSRSPTRSRHDHFRRCRLRNEDFEYPDLLGAVYEYHPRLR